MSHNRSKGILDVRWITALVMTAVLILGAVSMATATGSVGTAAGFEDDDGNMTQDSVWDWNSFAPITWDGTEPYRTSDHVDNGWTFKGIEDAVVTTSDTAFAGGTKQDDACPTVNTGKAPNKNDLQRIYLASKVVNDHTYLMLAWHRIPQNTTSSSAHIGFEFNKGNTPCPAGSDGLVERTAGDMLIVYDFEGSATDTPVLTMSRWTTSGACEVGSDSPPCWGTAINLTALGYAEGKVNTSDVGTITDQLSPTAPDATGLNEFGEAGIDLTAAGVFSAGTCESFGSAFGVSRSSGNSATAQMKDLVGPADFTIASCGTVITRKVTDPSGDATTSFGFTTNVANNPDTSPSPFSLKDGEHNDIFNVVADTSYNVTESDPSPNYKLTSIDCSASNTTSSYSTNTTTRAVTFDIAAGDILDCTFTNTLQRGAIKITKTSTKGGGGLDGATFSIVKGTPINGSPFTTANGGTICVDNLPFGDYSVTETGAPTGYKINDTSTHTVTVDNNAKCSDATYVGESISFDDTPLSKIQVIFTSLAGAGVTNASIVCQDSTPTVVPAVSENGDPDPAYDDTDETFTNLVPGTYTCTVVVDP